LSYASTLSRLHRGLRMLHLRILPRRQRGILRMHLNFLRLHLRILFKPRLSVFLKLRLGLRFYMEKRRLELLKTLQKTLRKDRAMIQKRRTKPHWSSLQMC
jgi:hypothetical protein